MKFRFHRGCLEESMKTYIEINNMDELQKVIRNDFIYYPIRIEKIIFSDPIPDTRNELFRNTYIVSAEVTFQNKVQTWVIGMSNSNTFENKESFKDL